MILVHNHHVIVPDTFDATIRSQSISDSTAETLAKNTIKIDLFGDDIMFGYNPDSAIDNLSSTPGAPVTLKVPTPPEELIKVFLPQYQLEIINRATLGSTSSSLLQGTDGSNQSWPDNITSNIIVINHGLNDAKGNVDVEVYKNNLVQLRQGLSSQQITVWQTPAETLTVNTAPYANAMIEVAAQFGDLVADTRKIKDWTNELVDKERPRQIGYSRLVDLVLSEKINKAVLRHLGNEPHEYYRKDHQEKFILDEETEITLSFTPLSSSWLEIYHRKNQSFYAVSRGRSDIALNPVNNVTGHLAAGIHNIETGDQIVTVQDGYTLTRIRREDGEIRYHKTFNIESGVDNARALATALNETSSEYIVVVTTYQDAERNRLTPLLAEAMYRCGASTEIFNSSDFKLDSAYILIGIPGVGAGGGLEAYAGEIDSDPYAYCEIEFELASNGVPYAKDIFPPVAKAKNQNDETVSMINPLYDLISGVPPINGDRILNPRYPTYKTSGIPYENYNVIGNKIFFNSPITGIVTVVCDTQINPSWMGATVDIDNIQNYATYKQRFTPARWAPGYQKTVYPPAGNSRTSPPQAVGANGVNALNLVNTQLKSRVGDALYAEPIVLAQPNFGYVRISADRKSMVYVPFPNYTGPDSFLYTLMTQHGQSGMPKCVYVEVYV